MEMNKQSWQLPVIHWLQMACACVAMLLVSTADAQVSSITWHAPAWKYRAIVVVSEADAQSHDTDVARVRIDHAGAMLANADDVRIFDLAGNAVPYEVTYQDPARYALISFQSTQQQNYRVIYFGNKAATADPLRTRLDSTTSAGMPVPGSEAQGWQPRTGLVLATYERPKGAPSPNTFSEFETLLKQAIQKPHGGDYRTTISDGVNPFGSSDAYVSVYRGWIHLPESGKWRFCTASSNASFSFIDGQKLVDWPGDHHAGQGHHGEFNTTLQLEKGFHYITYYHERSKHRPLAFLGIAKPNQKRFEALSTATVPQPRQASITAYESADGRSLAVPHIEIQDAVLIQQPKPISLTRVKVSAIVPAEQRNQWQVTWDMGDGQSVSGISAEHVYLEAGFYKVTMRATGGQGQRVEMDWPLVVYPDVNQPDDVSTVRANAYGEFLDAADPKQYTGRLAAMLAQVLEQIDHHPKAKNAAKTALFKHDLPPTYLPAMLALAYENAPASVSETRKLVAHFKQQLEREQEKSDETRRLYWLASLMRITTTWQRDIASAAALDASVETLKRTRNPSREMKEAMRQCALAMGDGYLMAGRAVEAKAQYELATSLAGRTFSEAQIRARSGMYPQQVDQQLEAGKPELALAVVEQWKNEIPGDQLTGMVWFLEGKSYLANKNPQAALHRLVPAAGLLRGGADEAQAFWLTAEAYRQAGMQEKALSTLRELTASGLTGPWVERAQKALENKP